MAAPHLDRAILIDYRAHRLPEAEELRVQRHLEACSECRDLAVEVSALFDPPEEGEEELAPAERSAGWTRVRAALEEQGWFAARREAMPRQKVWRWRAAKGFALLAAACLVLAVVGFPRLSMLGAQEQVLIPVGAFKGPRDELAMVRLPVLLKLRLTPTDSSPSYRVDVRDEKDREIASFRGLRPDPQGLLSVPLHRWKLVAGPYRLVVRAEGTGSGEPSGEYQFQIFPR